MTRIFIIILLAFNGLGAVYGGIMLISDQPCIDDEKVTLAELINYSKELETPEDFLTLECEQERQKLNTFEWLENKLILSF